ncbi:MAG: hypothetical protein ACOX5X_03820 [Acholeplasmataceae bacterium]|jgi:hypothetical protein
MNRTHILLIIAGLLLLSLLVMYLAEKRAKTKKQKEVLKKLEQIGTLEKDGKNYFLIIGDQQIQIIFLALRLGEYLTINSPTMMQIDRGRDKPLLIRYNYENPPYKWLFTVPGMNRVKRVINESEVVFINYQTGFSNFKVIKEDEVDLLIEEYKKGSN